MLLTFSASLSVVFAALNVLPPCQSDPVVGVAGCILRTSLKGVIHATFLPKTIPELFCGCSEIKSKSPDIQFLDCPVWTIEAGGDHVELTVNQTKTSSLCASTATLSVKGEMDDQTVQVLLRCLAPSTGLEEKITIKVKKTLGLKDSESCSSDQDCSKPMQCLSRGAFTKCSCPDLSERFLKVKDIGKCLSTSDWEQETTFLVLNNLVTVQKDVWVQQELHELEMRKRHKLEDERERKRSQALEDEFLLLKEIRGNIRRRLNRISKMSDSARKDDPKDCSEIYLHDIVDSGVYRVRSAWNFNKTFDVYCDMDTDGGGWTLIQRQGNSGFPKDYFQRNWNSYKNGFGDLTTDFWLGNEMILSLTNQGAYNIRFDFGDRRENDFAVYDSFWIEDESLKYRVHIDGYNNASGGAGDVFSHHNGSRFSTSDSNNALVEPGCPYRPPQGFDCETRECSAPTFNTNRGWWYKNDCKLDEKLKLRPATLHPQPNQEFVRTEIKIRPANFLKMKDMKPFVISSSVSPMTA